MPGIVWREDGASRLLPGHDEDVFAPRGHQAAKNVQKRNTTVDNVMTAL
jgi:hypothetical protein